MLRISLFLLLLFPRVISAQETDVDLKDLLSQKNEFVRTILNDTSYRVQLIFTEVIPTDSMNLILRRHKLVNDRYFYPASAVKLPVAILALEKIERLGLSLDDYLIINNDFNCGSSRYIEVTQSTNLTFRQLIEEMIVVSDNDYYNALYQFVTPPELNNRLHEMGLNESHIYKSFSGCVSSTQASTNSLFVKNQMDEIVYEQAICLMDSSMVNFCYQRAEDKLLGKKHEVRNKIVDGPYDFNFNLEVSLNDLNEMMLRMIYPENFSSDLRWKIKSEHQKFILQACAKYPRELKNVKYQDLNKYPDAWFKFVFSPLKMSVSKNERSVSKLGLSYGFTTEVAHVLNRADGVVFQIAISIYTNKNQIVNDGKYEYEEIARTFISQVVEILSGYIEKIDFETNEKLANLVAEIFEI